MSNNQQQYDRAHLENLAAKVLQGRDSVVSPARLVDLCEGATPQNAAEALIAEAVTQLEREG